MIKKQNLINLDKKLKSKNLIKNKFVDQETSSDTPKKISFKCRFIQWLKDLPLEQRYLAVKIQAPGLAFKIQQKLISIENNYTQQMKKDLNINKKISFKQSKQILQSIVLISDGLQFFGNIGFDFMYVDYPQRLYDLLTSNLTQVEKQQLLGQIYQIQKKQLKKILEDIPKAQTKQELSHIIINFIRSQIFFRFQQGKAICVQQQKNRKKQFSMYWRNLSQQYKTKILLLYKQDIKALFYFLNDKGIFILKNELEKQFNDLLKLDKNQLCNRIFKCKLKKSLTYLTQYHEQVYKAWKNQLIKKKKRMSKNSYIKNNQKINIVPHNHQIKSISHSNNQNSTNLCITNTQTTNNSQSKNQSKYQNKSKKIIQSISLNLIPSKNQINNNQELKNQNKRKRIRNRHNKKSTSAQSKQTKATSNKCIQDCQKQQKLIDNDNKIKYEDLQQQNKIQQLILNQQFKLIEAQISTANSFSNFNSNPQQKKFIQFNKIDFQNEIINKINIDIQQYNDLINQEANQFYQRRVIAYQRIQFMLNVWQVPIKLFGSCASGITIKNSDIDIAVNNSILDYFQGVPQSHKLKAALQQLQTIFSQQKWITSLKFIKTAAIPLIKMKVDTSINFTDIPNCQIPQAYIQSLNRAHNSSGQIHVDLTVETKNKQLQSNHLGIISTQCINKWLIQIKTLHPIIIIIKNYLTNQNLNITYEGGLNTYSMICMIVAFMIDNHLENQTNTAICLKQLVKFYGYQFNQQLKGIDVKSIDNIFYDKFQLKMTKSTTQKEEIQLKAPQLIHAKSQVHCQADLEIKDPLNNGKNMTKNCYSFPKIKQIFKKIYQECFQKYQKKLQKSYQEEYQIRTKQILNWFDKQNQIDNESEVKQLIKKSKEKIGNPFLSLFD